MRKIQILLAIGLLISCKRTDHKTLFERYNDGYYNEGFNSISSLLADSVTIKDGPNYEMKYSKDEFRLIYQWDSTFQPQNKFTIIDQTDTTIDFIEERYSKRFEFLEHDTLKMKQRIHLKDGQISIIENREYLNFDLNKWTSNRDSLVSWIDKNHPELSGFIYDMTKEGAENYLKAIELYNNAL
jgi:hypothetical protein